MDDNAKTLKKLYIGQIVNRILLILAMIILIANLVGTIIMAVEIDRIDYHSSARHQKRRFAGHRIAYDPLFKRDQTD